MGRDDAPVVQADMIPGGFDHLAAQDDLDAHVLQLLARGVLQPGGIGVQQMILRLDQDHAPGRIGNLPGVFFAEHVAIQLAQGADGFQAGRPPADDHQRGQCLTPGRIVQPGGVFKALEDVIAQDHGFRQGFQPEGVLLDRRVAEVVSLAPGGNDQIVIRLLAGFALAPDGHGVVHGVDGFDAAEQEAHVRSAVQDAAYRVGDLARLQAGGGDLVEQGGEQVEVLAVDQQDLDVRFRQLFGRVQTPKARADDDDLRTMRHVDLLALGVPGWSVL